MRKVIILLLVIPLMIVIVVQNPVGAGHFIETVVTAGAKLLSAVATGIGSLLGGH